jgi:ATP-dependent helicase/nuclease subunit A
MRLHFDGKRVSLDLTDPELRLTPAQQRAMATDRELVVVAGAGTGKTYTLAMRYVALLLELANQGEQDVERVLVLTFTDKAATEMAERCHRQLKALCTAVRAAAREWDSHAPQRVGSRIASALEEMEDNFDRARISTFHSFCARLLAEFPGATRTPPGTRPLPPGEAARRMDQALDEALEEHLATYPADIEPLLDTFSSRAGLLDAGRTALGRYGLLGDLLSRHAEQQITVEQWLQSASPDPASAARWTEKVGLPSLEMLQRLCAPSGGGPFLQDVLVPSLGQLPEAGDGSALRVYARYRAVLSLLLTEQGTLRKLDHQTVIGTRAQWPDERRYTQAKEAIRALQAKLSGGDNDWCARAASAVRLPTMADRQMLAALAPFSRWVRLAAQRFRASLDRSRAISFEEMQRRAIEAVTTSSAVQQRLREQFRYLMVDEFQDTDEPQWSLVRAVGRAEPGVPEDRIFVVGDPKQAIYGFRGGDPTVFHRAIRELGAPPIPLTDNFRSTPALIGWFNRLFPSLLTAETVYDPLVARRADDGETPTLVRCDERGDPAQATARVIAQQLGPGSRWLDREQYPSPPIALLLRSRTRQARYEAALRQQGIPFVVVSGIGLWSRPEVLDVVNTLSAIAHGEPRSIVGYLRSPLGGLTDDEVARFRLDKVAEGSAVERYHRWRQRARHVSAQALLREVVEEMVPGLVATDDSGRALQNVQRVVEIATSWGNLPTMELADRLVAEVETVTREAEVNLVPSEARVVLCTVHAAKGLEFPVVVVSDLSARVRSRVPTLLVGRAEDGQIAIASRVLDPEADVQVRVDPGRWAALQAQLRTDEDAEERRLLYVAATRARDHLILVGTAQPPLETGGRASWMQLLEAALPRGTEVLASVREVPVLELGTPKPRQVPAAAAPPRPAPPARALPVQASALDRYRTCPARWLRSEGLGIAEPEAPSAPRERELWAAMGQVLHQILQDGVEGDETDIRARLRAAWGRLGATADEHRSGLSRLQQHLEATAANPEVRRALDAPGWSDLPVQLPAEGLTLCGRLDRLWLDRERGGFVVLDWKSEPLAGRTAAQVAAQYELQLLAYGWASDQILQAQRQPGVVRAAVVLTETGEVVESELSAERLAQVPALLRELGATLSMPWEEVEREARRSPRPCATCGYRGRGCQGAP